MKLCRNWNKMGKCFWEEIIIQNHESEFVMEMNAIDR